MQRLSNYWYGTGAAPQPTLTNVGTAAGFQLNVNEPKIHDLLYRGHPEELLGLKVLLEQLSDATTQHDRATRDRLGVFVTNKPALKQLLELSVDSSPAKAVEIQSILDALDPINAIVSVGDAVIDPTQVTLLNGLIPGCLARLNKNLEANRGVMSRFSDSITGGVTQVSDLIMTANLALQDRLIQTSAVFAQGNTAVEQRMIQFTQVMAQLTAGLTQGDDSVKQRMIQLTQVMAQFTRILAQADTALTDRMIQATQVLAQADTSVHDRMIQTTQAMAQFTQVLAQADTAARERMLQASQAMIQATQVVAQVDQAAHDRVIQLTQLVAQLDHTMEQRIIQFTQAVAQTNNAAFDRMTQAAQLTAQADLAVQDRMAQSAQVLIQADQFAARIERIVVPTVQLATHAGQALGVVPGTGTTITAPVIPVTAGGPPPAGTAPAPGGTAPASWIDWSWLSSQLATVSQKLLGTVSDAAFNATLSFLALSLEQVHSHIEKNTQTGPVGNQIKAVVDAIRSFTSSAQGSPDRQIKWVHAKNTIDTLIAQLNGVKIYLNGVGLPTLPAIFGDHPASLVVLKKVLDLLSDPVYCNDQTTRDQLKQIMMTQQYQLRADLSRCSDPTSLQDVPAILDGLSMIYNIACANTSLPIDPTLLPNLSMYVNACRIKLIKNFESNHTQSATDNTIAPIDAFAKSSSTWRPPEAQKTVRTEAQLISSVESQITRIAAHSSELGFIKFVNESLCGNAATFGVPAQDYFTAIQDVKRSSSDPAVQAENLRTALFAQIDRSDVWFFRKWVAKLSYYLMRPLTNHLSENFAKKLAENFKQSLVTLKEDNYTTVQNQIIEGLSGYLCALSSAYDRVANNPLHTGTLDQELAIELQNPALNGNYATSHDLYNAVVRKALNEFKPTAGWIDGVFTYLDKVRIPSTSAASFLNPVIAGTLKLVGAFASVFLFIPEKIIDFTIYRTVKGVIVKNQILDRILKEGLSSLETPSGHTHAVNVIILNLLKQVWKRIVDDESAQASNVTHGSTELIPISDGRRQKLRGLIESLFQVLGKSQHATPEALKNYITSGSLVTAGKKAIDSYVGDNVLEPTIDILAQMFQETEWLEIVDQALQSANDNFEKPNTVTEAEMNATQEAIGEYLQRVLYKAVGKAVDQKFDVDKKLQEREMDKRLSQIKGDAADFRDLIFGDNHIGTMLRPVDLPLAPTLGTSQVLQAEAWFTTVQSLSAGGFQIQAIEQATANFLNEVLTDHNKHVQNNPTLDQKSKNELSSYYSTLLQSFDDQGSYKKNIQFAKEKQGELYHWIHQYNSFSPAVGSNLALQDFILEPAQSLDLIDQERSTLATIADGLAAQGIADNTPVIRHELDRMSVIRKDNLNVVEEVSVLFEDFMKEKHGLLSNKYFGLFSYFSSLGEKRAKLEARIEALLPDSLGYDAISTKALLLGQIKAIAESKVPAVVGENASHSRNLLTAYKLNWTAAFDQHYATAKIQVAELTRNIQVRVLEQRAHILRIKKERDVLLGFAKEGLQTTTAAIGSIQKKPIVDTQYVNVKPVINTVKEQVYRLLQDKSEGYIRLVRKPAILQGVFHRGLINVVGESAT